MLLPWGLGIANPSLKYPSIGVGNKIICRNFSHILPQKKKREVFLSNSYSYRVVWKEQVKIKNSKRWKRHAQNSVVPPH